MPVTEELKELKEGIYECCNNKNKYSKGCKLEIKGNEEKKENICVECKLNEKEKGCQKRYNCCKIDINEINHQKYFGCCT